MNIGIQALATHFPSIKRTNDYWVKKYPDVVTTAETRALASLLRGQTEGPTTPFDAAMAPHLSDPFRGSVVRYVRAEGETGLSMEAAAARAALAKAGLGPRDVDLTLVSSLIADQQGVGNAAYLARELGLKAPAFSFDSACASSVVGLHTACAMIKGAAYKKVLVVVSASNSVQLDEKDTLSWFVGDGAAAFVVGPVAGRGVMGYHTVNTTETCDMFRIHVEDSKLRTHAHPKANSMARDTAEIYLRACVEGALQNAGVTKENVAFFSFHSPTVFYPEFCARVIGVPENKWMSTYSKVANVGSVVMPFTLQEAAKEGRIKPGDLVLAYAVGSSATASAVVMEWGEGVK